MHIPRLLIAGTRTGEGKTTVALALMAAWRQRGLRVQGFKVGPDYLDTGYQLLASGQVGRNLDPWMMGEEAVGASLRRHGGAADITVIEGAMGLYDGHRDGVTATSTAEVAKLTRTPVLLVIDAERLDASVGAMALGYRLFDPAVQIVGAILNRWTPSRSKIAIERAMARAEVPILGYLPPLPEATLPTRHLGLVMAEEMREEVAAILHTLGERLAAQIDIDRLLALARAAEVLPALPPRRSAPAAPARASRWRATKPSPFTTRIISRCWKAPAREVVYFSPLRDREPPEVDGLYLGGGYPELHAARLAANQPLRAGLAAAIAAGLPTYAGMRRAALPVRIAHRHRRQDLADGRVRPDASRHAITPAAHGLP